MEKHQLGGSENQDNTHLLEQKLFSDTSKLTFTCPMIISEDSTEFIKDKFESKFEAPGDLMRQLVKMCDGKKTVKQIMEELSKEWDKDSLSELFNELVVRKILVEATRKILDAYEMVQNPQPYFNEVSKDETVKLEENAQVPKYPGQKEELIPESPLIELISKRESCRRFSKETIEQGELEKMLWCTYGRLARNPEKKTVPSGGALYPLNINLVLFKQVGEYSPGIYRVTGNDKMSVGLVKVSEKQSDVYGDFIDPITLQDSNGVILISSDISESSKKYGNRSFHYSVLEAGHAAQNFLLSAAEQGVATLEVGGYYDEMIKKTLEENESSTPLISIVFGKKEENPLPEDKYSPELFWFKPEHDGYRVPFHIAVARLSEDLVKQWSFGRDADPVIAKIKATSESREWASCSCVPDTLVRAKLSDLDNAIDPLSIYSLTDQQYASGKIPFNRFSNEDQRDWVEAEKISDGSKHLVLADFVYFPFNPGYDIYGYANTSGVAAHPEKQIALQSAVLELVERDAFTISYLAQLQHPTIKKNSLVKLQDRIKALEDKGFKVTFKDVSLDLAPVVLIYVTNDELGYTSCTTSSNFDIEKAADHALMEIEGCVLSYLSNGRSEVHDPEKLATPQDHGGLYEQREFYKKAEFLIAGNEEVDVQNAGKSSARTWQDLMFKFKERKMDVYTVEQKVYDKYGGNQGLHIYRAIIPGIVPMTFGSDIQPGGNYRIYEIAKTFADKDLTYDDLTKFPHPFA